MYGSLADHPKGKVHYILLSGSGRGVGFAGFLFIEEERKEGWRGVSIIEENRMVGGSRILSARPIIESLFNIQDV